MQNQSFCGEKSDSPMQNQSFCGEKSDSPMQNQLFQRKNSIFLSKSMICNCKSMNSLRNSMVFCPKCVTVQAFWHRNVKKPKRNQDFQRKTSIFLSKSMVCNRKSMNSLRNSMAFCPKCVTVQAFWHRNVKKPKRNQYFRRKTSIFLSKWMVCNRKSMNSLRNSMVF